MHGELFEITLTVPLTLFQAKIMLPLMFLMEVSPYSFFDVSLTSAYFLKHPVLISLTREYKIVSRGCLVQTKYIQYSKYLPYYCIL